jgi:hypothetical protein
MSVSLGVHTMKYGATYAEVWTLIEYTDAALAMFIKQMASMTGGWGGSFEKLEEWLPTEAPLPQLQGSPTLAWQVDWSLHSPAWELPFADVRSWPGLRDGGRRLYGDPQRPAGSGRCDHGPEDPPSTLT